MSTDQRIVVGCPIKGREWLIRPWFEHVLVSLAETDLQYSFMFVLDEGDPVEESIQEVCQEYRIPAYFTQHAVYTGPRADTEHHWTDEKISNMVDLRNDLLNIVRSARPDYFLSLDSDILVHPGGIANLVDTCDQQLWDAVGGKTYLSRTSRLPSYAHLHRATKQLIRPDSMGVFKVDVLMAMKLMTPAAYDIDYEYERRGEDIGWSLAAKRAGLTLGFDGRIAHKHIMEQSMLDSLDKRVGY